MKTFLPFFLFTVLLISSCSKEESIAKMLDQAGLLMYQCDSFNGATDCDGIYYNSLRGNGSDLYLSQDNYNYLAWSPNGKLAYKLRKDVPISIRSLNGQKEQLFFYNDEQLNDMTWSANGRFLCYVSGWQGPLRVLDMEGNEAVELHSAMASVDSGRLENPQLSAQGNSLLFYHNRTPNGSDLYHYDFRSEKTVLVSTTQNASPGRALWTKDESGILLVRGDSLLRYDVASAQEEFLLREVLMSSRLHLSPDGRQLAYLQNSVNEGLGLSVLDLETKRTIFVDKVLSRQLTWSEDSKQLIYAVPRAVRGATHVKAKDLQESNRPPALIFQLNSPNIRDIHWFFN
ncbi:MAG: hypothetical protein AAFV25_10630 [Bacteroidota bacterium]